MDLPNIKTFPEKLYNKLVAKYLKNAITDSKNVIITAGKTVKPIYRLCDNCNFKNKVFYLSDERIVPYSSKLSNYSSLKNYNFIKKNKFIHFNIYKKFLKKKTELYFKEISKVKKIDTSILTVGKNCHIASIFFNKKTKFDQIYFFNEYNRVSISLKLLSQSKKIILICNKKERAKELANNLKNKKKIFKFLSYKNMTILFDKKSYKYFIGKINEIK